MTLALPTTGVAAGRRELDGDGRNLASTNRIEPSEEFKFRITNIKNPPSFEPTGDSIIYSVYTSEGILVEELSAGYQITNTEPGPLSHYKNGLLPDDFRASFETNYTLELYLANYKQNLDIVLTLPPEISFATDTIKCYGLQGTDSEDLACTEDRENK